MARLHLALSLPLLVVVAVVVVVVGGALAQTHHHHHHDNKTLSFRGAPICTDDLISAGCLPCERCVINSREKARCLPVDHCCAYGDPPLTCARSPCRNYRKLCPRAKHCVVQACRSFGCMARFLDAEFNVLSERECTYSTTVEPVEEEDGEEVEEAKSASGRRRKIHVKRQSRERRSERPTVRSGRCPQTTVGTSILGKISIKTRCSNKDAPQCRYDQDCSNGEKCCLVSGCGRRCVEAVKKVNSNQQKPKTAKGATAATPQVITIFRTPILHKSSKQPNIDYDGL